jgi:hypothetical protein
MCARGFEQMKRERESEVDELAKTTLPAPDTKVQHALALGPMPDMLLS